MSACIYNYSPSPSVELQSDTSSLDQLAMLEAFAVSSDSESDPDPSSTSTAVSADAPPSDPAEPQFRIITVPLGKDGYAILVTKIPPPSRFDLQAILGAVSTARELVPTLEYAPGHPFSAPADPPSDMELDEDYPLNYPATPVIRPAEDVSSPPCLPTPPFQEEFAGLASPIHLRSASPAEALAEFVDEDCSPVRRQGAYRCGCGAATLITGVPCRWIRSNNYGGDNLDYYRVVLLQNYLDGEAHRWYVTETREFAKENDGGVPEFADLICAMHRRFIKSSSAQRATRAFNQVKWEAELGPEQVYADLKEAGQRMVEMPAPFALRSPFMDLMPDWISKELRLHRGLTDYDYTMRAVEDHELDDEMTDTETSVTMSSLSGEDGDSTTGGSGEDENTTTPGSSSRESNVPYAPIITDASMIGTAQYATDTHCQSYLVCEHLACVGQEHDGPSSEEGTVVDEDAPYGTFEGHVLNDLGDPDYPLGTIIDITIPAGPSVTEADIADAGIRNLLSSLTGGVIAPYPAAVRDNSPAPDFGIDWNLMEANNEGNLAPSADQQAVAAISQGILERFDELPRSDDEFEERSDEEPEVVNEPHIADTNETDPEGSDSQPRKRARTKDETTTSRFWYPWPDRITCTLDILMHLPRSVFSQRQLDLFLWLLKVNHVDDVPSVKSMQTINLALQKICGIESIPYDGALGHKYYVNSLAQIIAQEMANPKVRPHLHFYPEDSGPKLSEARQGQRWLNELGDDRITPMVRILKQDFYVHEPAMLDDGHCVVPTRWFMKDNQMFARCWDMQVVTNDSSWGWRVIRRADLVVPATRFLKDFVTLQRDAATYSIPHPSLIIDVVDLATMSSEKWTYTNPVLGNPWRAKAEGHRVVVFPLWMYCDDTSGNMSKKWNEHNSFLMTPAGLPREESQKEYNIHFLCTSNLARPLEMLDGIVEQLETAQEAGIWAWDMVHEEPVLIIPEVLALLGDNPMQSEFACHIGLRGKLFCRACWVKGTDAMDQEEGVLGPDAGSEAGSAAGSDAESAVGADSEVESIAGDEESGSGPQPVVPGPAAAPAPAAVGKSATKKTNSKGKGKGKGKKVRESMLQMVERVKSFMKVGRLRNKEETTTTLRSYFTEASEKLDTKTKVKNLQTANGVKDKYQTHFIEQLFNSYKKKRGQAPKTAARDAKLAQFPPITMSPVWRIKGLDPHQDTPVEILHVILLGFVKYLWRDLVQLQYKTNDEKKNLLATRLSSLDVSGLGISPLAGRTLVQYAGSLTGRDFRAIAQVAPFVLYDLVSDDCFKTWQALSKIVPLIWQPEIADIEPHIAVLTAEIEHFLLCAARWTNRWFNKPKFHIFVHLPAHIRRFGPAILFATEAFESFNAIIRAKSVHSNRHAPSRDIAHAFAQGNRIRHLLSGGLFLLKTPHEPAPSSATVPSAPNVTVAPIITRAQQVLLSTKPDWNVIGKGPQSLVASRCTVTGYLGLDLKIKPAGGVCVADNSKPKSGNNTLTKRHIPAWEPGPHLFQTQKNLSLHNGDVCEPGSFVIVHRLQQLGQTFVARVQEILQRSGSQASFASQPDIILLQHVFIDNSRTRYGMPSIQFLDEWTLHNTDELICTVNVQHNCLDNKCGATGTRPVYQERCKTTQTRAQVAHLNINDMVLNTAQMRDAIHVQKYRVAPDALDFDTIVFASAAKELKARKDGDPAPRLHLLLQCPEE
ncbi:hypothetical protein C8R46DRAFT_1232351 [Mycena filopes]|nr:hypothetical protein C8R46DRAFT_1232351 [Mycena filopes]